MRTGISNLQKFIVLMLVVVACKTVPIIGRKQLSFFPEADVLAMSKQQYREFLQSTAVQKGTAADSMVQRVGNRLAGAVNRFFIENKLGERVKEFEWEFKVVQSNEVNAWCMPGGKIVVYTGILPIMKDEAGMVTVMSHEIAHAVARHGNERMSQQMAVQLGGIALDIALSKEPDKTRNFYNQAYGITSTLAYILPFSRKHESEADKLGLIFMAMADYDPNTAIPFWERMKAIPKDSPPPFLSTHPSDEQRIETLKKFMPTALKYYRKQQKRENQNGTITKSKQ
jgi:predicted Zn-dependent protease